MKRCICFLLAMTLLLAGCSGQEPERKKYTATFLTLFDTVTSIVGFAESEEAFQETAQQVHDDLLYYHQLFDIYQEYEGIANLKTINDSAAVAPVKTEKAVIDLLLDCKAYYTLTGGKVNAAMGSVLALWHEARNEGIDDPRTARLPDQDALEEASRHTDFDRVIIDEAASTVFITDPGLRLDVGAIAKGWSVQKVCETAPEGLLISVGGNVCATGLKDEAGSKWVVGIQHPDKGSEYLHTLYLGKECLVTSGDYQRNYVVDGQLYHHIIDPDTLFPSTYWRSVTILCADSGMADALSTALFLLPQAQGQALLDQTGAMAIWVAMDGSVFYSPGIQELIRT